MFFFCNLHFYGDIQEPSLSFLMNGVVFWLNETRTIQTRSLLLTCCRHRAEAPVSGVHDAVAAEPGAFL